MSVIQEKSDNPDFLAEVKVPSNVVIPAGYKRQVRCRVKASCEDSQSVYFSPKSGGDGEEDFTILESVSELRRGRSNYVYVEVMNETGHEKLLKKGFQLLFA